MTKHNARHGRGLSLLLPSLLLLSGLLSGVATAEIRQPVTSLSLWNRGECTRISEFSFSVPDTARNVAIYRAGVPMRYGDTVGTWRYGLITAVADAGATLTVTIIGANMTSSYDDYCEYGSETLLRFDTIVVPGLFADASDSTLLLHDLKMIVPPHKGTPRYLIGMCARSVSDDTGANQPFVRATVNGSTAITNIYVVDNAWVCGKPDGYASYYDLQYGETWEIYVSDTGTNDDSSDLTIQLVWLQEE